MDSHQARALQTLISRRVVQHDELRALALCGSWARGNARPDSDLDLIVLVRDASPDAHLRLIRTIPWSSAGLSPQAIRWATYGIAHSAHITLGPHTELELTFADEIWANANPVDPGTRRVVIGGFQVLADKDGALARALAVLN
jgi:hypothetical protein